MWTALFVLQVAASPSAPVTCYERATDDAGLSEREAIELCRGARSDMPARCANEADDRTLLSNLDIVRLCQRTTSLAPIDCFERLDDETTLGETQVVGYCAAERGFLIAPPYGGDPRCVNGATDETFLSQHEALRLCRGAADDAPLACFRAGDRTLLSNLELIHLCAPVYSVPLGYLHGR